MTSKELTVGDARSLSEKLATIKARATAAGAKVVTPLLMEPEKTSAVSILLDEAQMLDLIDHLKPKVVFVVEVAFDALTEIMLEIGDEELDVDELERDKRVKPLLKRWRERDGETSRVVISMLVDGVFYNLMEQAAWLEQFEGEAEEVADELLDD
jgi:hypothetical protein